MLVEFSPADRQLLRQIIISVDASLGADDARATVDVIPDRPIPQARYLIDNPRWLEIATMWRRVLRDSPRYNTPELKDAFESGLAFGFEAAIRPYIKIENPSAVS